MLLNILRSLLFFFSFLDIYLIYYIHAVAVMDRQIQRDDNRHQEEQNLYKAWSRKTPI